MKKLLFFLSLLSASCFLTCSEYDLAYLAYRKGEEAKTFEERCQFFNEALRIYQKNEKEDGKLYFNIGNCYYQLGRVGLAIWYYTKAERLLPRDSKIKENLIQAQNSVQLETSYWEKIQKKLFFFHYKLKSSERALSIMLLLSLLTLLISLSIWIKKAYFKPLIYFSAFLVAVLSISHFTSISYKQGLFIEPSILRCAGGMQYKEIDNEFVKPGEHFKILEISEDRQWLQVKTKSGKKGYTLSKQVRLL